MAKKEKEPTPQHDEYVENFQALTNGMNLNSIPRDEGIAQVDRLLDKHALDYPEIVIGYQLTRLEVEVVGMLA